MRWIQAQWLDYVAKRAVRASVEELRAIPDELIARSWRIYWDTFFVDPDIPDDVKTVQHDQLEKAVAKIREGVDPSDGIGCLTGYCVGEITRRYLVFT